MTTRTRAAGLLTAITMTAVLAACSSSSDDSGGGSDAVSEVAGSDTGSGAESGARSPAPRAAQDASEDGGGAASDDATGAQGPSTPEMERSVISSGTVSLVSKDVARTRQDVQRVVDAQGGEITEENTDTDDDGDTSYSRLVVRVPSEKFAAAMSALEQAGTLSSSSRGSDDVTTEVIDTGVRVRAQEASLERVELLLAEAEDLKDIIWIESQLTSRQAELDSLKSQRSWLADQTSLSTITVDISTQQVVEDESEDTDEPAGFLAGLKGGTGALLTVLAAVTTIVGVLLPFAVVGLVVGLPVWLVVRRRRRSAAPGVPAA